MRRRWNQEGLRLFSTLLSFLKNRRTRTQRERLVRCLLMLPSLHPTKYGLQYCCVKKISIALGRFFEDFCTMMAHQLCLFEIFPYLTMRLKFVLLPPVSSPPLHAVTTLIPVLICTWMNFAFVGSAPMYLRACCILIRVVGPFNQLPIDT